MRKLQGERAVVQPFDDDQETRFRPFQMRLVRVLLPYKVGENIVPEEMTLIDAYGRPLLP